MRRFLVGVVGIVVFFAASSHYMRETRVPVQVQMPVQMQAPTPVSKQVRVSPVRASTLARPTLAMPTTQAASPLAKRFEPAQPRRWFSREEIHAGVLPLSLVPLFETDAQVADEIGRVVDDRLNMAMCNRYDRDYHVPGDEIPQRVSVRPIMTLVATAQDGQGRIEMLDLETLPDILSEATEACIWEALDGYEYTAYYGPYSYTFKHLARYLASAKLLEDDPKAASQRRAEHRQNPPTGIF